MRKLSLLALVVLALSPAALAQNGDDYHKVEVSGGYSYGRFEPNSGTQTVTAGPDVFSFEPCTPDGADILGGDLQRIFCERRGFQGFDASVAYNFTKYLGVKGNVSGHFKKDRTVDQFTDAGVTRTDTNDLTDRTWQFLAGLQVKNNSREARVKPFAHALFGVARQTSHDVQSSTGGFNFTLDDEVTSFSMKLGGGIDLRLSEHVDLRVIEVNYNPIFAGDRDVPGNADFDLRVAGRTAHNFTIGVGIAFH